MGRLSRAALGVLAALTAVTATAAANPSLPHVGSGHRPGPDILYATAADAPQLQNVAPFRARPIMVSGAGAYRRGEFLYQDYLHDDRGATGTPDPGDPTGSLGLTFKAKAGTLTYPTGPAYAGNAADLVELRVKPLAHATLLRVTLNTLLDARIPAVTFAIGDSPVARQWPHGAHVRSPAALFLTVHGDTAELVDAASGAAVVPAPSARVDVARRQITISVPHAAWDPGRTTVRLAAGVGLWDAPTRGYAQPRGTATATAPGGAAQSGAALFNVAFRPAEPWPGRPAPALTLIDASLLAAVRPAWWRELSQAQALAAGDISAFAAHVDFARLLAGATDNSAVPTHGLINRIFASHQEFRQGLDPKHTCGRFPAHCEGALGDRLQAYTVYVPRRARPAGGWGMTLLLHALVENHNEYAGSRYQSQLGERGRGYLVVTPSGRGPDGDYTDAAEANVFETWADVARHYRLDPSRVTLSGYSMGGGGTYRLMSRWPDLFARGAGVGAAPIEAQTGAMAGMRNTPVMSWVGVADEGTQPPTVEQSIARETALGLDFTFDQFPLADHGTIPAADEFAPFAAFLGDHVVDRDPPHISYGEVPRLDFPRSGVVADHAYWLSGMTRRNAAAPASIDARSEGFGLEDPVARPVALSTGVLQGGQLGPVPYIERRLTHDPARPAPVADHVVITVTNLATVTIDARRARLSCHPALEVHSDGPLVVRVACPKRRTG